MATCTSCSSCSVSSGRWRRLPESWRLFAAAPLPAPAAAEVWARLAPLRSRFPDTRWTSPELFHLTLVFLGQTDARRLESIVDCPFRNRPAACCLRGLDRRSRRPRRRAAQRAATRCGMAGAGGRGVTDGRADARPGSCAWRASICRPRAEATPYRRSARRPCRPEASWRCSPGACRSTGRSSESCFFAATPAWTEPRYVELASEPLTQSPKPA